MREDIRDNLIQIARSQELINYDELNRQLNFILPPDRDLIGTWLGEISEYEVREGRHMLSAIVVHKEGEGFGDPGKGFYDFAQQLGIYDGSGDLGACPSKVAILN